MTAKAETAKAQTAGADDAEAAVDTARAEPGADAATRDATRDAAPDATRDAAIRRVLRHGHNIDITTTGRRSGQPRRIEITFHSFDGHLYISGMPSHRTRAWLRNLRADPRFTFHLKALLKADLPATAREITDETERRAVLEKVARVWNRDAEPMVRFSPLIEVVIDGYAPAPLGQGSSGPAQ